MFRQLRPQLRRPGPPYLMRLEAGPLWNLASGRWYSASTKSKKVDAANAMSSGSISNPPARIPLDGLQGAAELMSLGRLSVNSRGHPIGMGRAKSQSHRCRVG